MTAGLLSRARGDGAVEFTFRIEGGPNVRLSRSVLSGNARLNVDGKDVPRSAAPGRPFLVPRGDGTTVALYVRGRGYDYVPAVEVDGKAIRIARDLARWEYVLCALPLLLIFAGGLVGFGAMALNQWVMRTSWPYAARVGATLGVLVVGLVLVALAVLAIEASFAGTAA